MRSQLTKVFSQEFKNYAVRAEPNLANFGPFSPKCPSVFPSEMEMFNFVGKWLILPGNVKFYRETLATFKDLFAMLGEHWAKNSRYLIALTPKFFQLCDVTWVVKKLSKFIFVKFCQKPDWTSDQNILSPKRKITKIFFLLGARRAWSSHSCAA